MITSPEAYPSKMIPVLIVFATAEPNAVMPINDPMADKAIAWFVFTALVAIMLAVA